MSAARLLPFLLPLGIWLAQSTATPRAQESRLAASGLVAIIVSFLAYLTLGFGFMFGGVGTVTSIPDPAQSVSYFTLPVADQTWGILGLRGFLLYSVPPAALDLFISFAPLVATVAVMLSSILVSRTGMATQITAVTLISGFIFPVAGFWLWGGGWLGALGINLNLGHGAVDIGGVSTAAVTAGAAGMAWLLRGSRDQQSLPPQLPASYHPFRALIGIVCMIIGACAFFAGNSLYPTVAESATSQYTINILVACSVASLVALAYSAFALHRPDILITGRAVLAALIMTAAGGILYSSGVAALLGLLAALIAILGAYTMTIVLRIRDDIGIVTTALLAGIAGLMCVGVFANGNYGSGWNSVGAKAYLGINGMGISGLVSTGTAATDPGQLTAQLTAIFAIVAFSFAIFAIPALAIRRVSIPQYSSDIAMPAPQAASISQSQDISPTPEPISVTATSSQKPAADKPNPGATLLERLRMARVVRASNKSTPAPAQARHVAYPMRAGGRRVLLRPLMRSKEAPVASESGEKAD